MLVYMQVNWYVHDAQTNGKFAQFDSPGQSLVETASSRHDYYKFRPKYISEFVELYFLAEVTSWQISARSSHIVLSSHFLTSITLLFIPALYYITLWALLYVSHCWLPCMIGQIYFRVGWTYKTNSDWSNILYSSYSLQEDTT